MEEREPVKLKESAENAKPRPMGLHFSFHGIGPLGPGQEVELAVKMAFLW